MHAADPMPAAESAGPQLAVVGAPPARPSPLGSAVRATGPLIPLQTLTNGLWLSLVAAIIIAAWILVDLQGWAYYTTPLGIRGYLPAHKVLRPTGKVGHVLGMIGGLMMLAPVAYALRKRLKVLARAGSMRTWLEVHIFCGLVGPLLVTFHTSFKFNGLVSVAYWAMVIVALSGVVGRYLYVRIPKTVRGLELTREDIARRAAELRNRSSALGLPASARAEVEHLERALEGGLTRYVPARWLAWRTRWRTRHHVRGAHAIVLREALSITRERAALARRLATLERTRRLFALWHVFHLPLVYLMFVIVTLHVGLTLYLGYWPFH